MNNKQIISIDDAKFKKTSKKLHKHLLTFNSEIKLSEAQEILSQSLGFRNLHELQNYINKTELIEDNNRSFLNKLNSEQIVKIISLLMFDNNEIGMWEKRAIQLLNSIIPILVYLRDNQQLNLNIDSIQNYLNLDYLTKLHLNNTFPNNIKRYLSNYLFSIPGFVENQQLSEATYEQHSYLKMQIEPILYLLEKVENEDFIIYSEKWNDYTKIMKKININDTWICMEGYEKIAYSSIEKDMKVSDLIIYITSIISPKEQNKILILLKSILSNYKVASQISQNIVNIIN